MSDFSQVALNQGLIILFYSASLTQESEMISFLKLHTHGKTK